MVVRACPCERPPWQQPLERPVQKQWEPAPDLPDSEDVAMTASSSLLGRTGKTGVRAYEVPIVREIPRRSASGLRSSGW